MKRGALILFAIIGVTASAHAQQEGWYTGPASVGASEPLFRFDEQERWKHGYLQAMPFYGGGTYFRPYNYHHVFSQVPTAAGWGMSAGMPYSQQFWHKYEKFTDLSRGHDSPLQPYEPPVKQFDHYPKPIGAEAWNGPALQVPSGQGLAPTEFSHTAYPGVQPPARRVAPVGYEYGSPPPEYNQLPQQPAARNAW